MLNFNINVADCNKSKAEELGFSKVSELKAFISERNHLLRITSYRTLTKEIVKKLIEFKIEYKDLLSSRPLTGIELQKDYSEYAGQYKGQACFDGAWFALYRKYKGFYVLASDKFRSSKSDGATLKGHLLDAFGDKATEHKIELKAKRKGYKAFKTWVEVELNEKVYTECTQYYVQKNGVKYHTSNPLTLEHYHALDEKIAVKEAAKKKASQYAEERQIDLENTIVDMNFFHEKLGFCHAGMRDFCDAVGFAYDKKISLKALKKVCKSVLNRGDLAEYTNEIEQVINF